MKAALENPPASQLEKRIEPGTKQGNEPTSSHPWNSLAGLWERKTTVIAVLSIIGIALHLVLHFGFRLTAATYPVPLLVTLSVGGIPLLYDLLRKLRKGDWGSDLLGGISVVTSVMMGEYLAGSIIVLMLSGGRALESYALQSASSVLAALAQAYALRGPSQDRRFDHERGASRSCSRRHTCDLSA